MRLCFACAKSRFSHDAAHFKILANLCDCLNGFVFQTLRTELLLFIIGFQLMEETSIYFLPERDRGPGNIRGVRQPKLPNPWELVS